MHSTTKYLNGHSDSIGGIVVATREDDIEWLQFVQNAQGAILGPFDSWLVLRGTKTLPIRMRQHNANGLALAEFGPEQAMRKNPHLRAGLNVYKNTLTYKAVAEAQNLPYRSAEDVLGA